MLVLSRQRNERLKFTGVFTKDAAGNFVPVEEFFVTINGIRGDHVRIGIDAPKAIGIDRCGPDGVTQTITDEHGKRRAIEPASPNDPRPRCPECHSHLSMHIAHSTSLHCINCKHRYPCPHTQTKTLNIKGGHPTEVCVNCKTLQSGREKR